MACTPQSGTCATCRSGCTHKPGWFLPGEAEKAAELLGVPFAEFFATYLAVDWWEADSRIDETVFVLSPAIVGEETGTEFPGDPRGSCVFYKDERCQIHAAKPFECRARWCGDLGPSTVHLDTAGEWNAPEHQGQIRDLLGREPEEAEFEGGLSSLFGSIW